MIHIEASTQIGRPRDEVFDFLTDPDNLTKWQNEVIRSKPLTQGPMRVGYQFAETAKVGLWKLEMVCTVVDIKPNERFAFQIRSTGPIDCDIHFDLQPVAGGTRLTLSGAGKLKGFWRLLQPMMAADVRRQMRTEVATIKLLLEVESPVPSRSAI